jgi:hypothetical protein
VGENHNEGEMERDKPGKSELILYQTEDGKSRLEVRFEGETVWLTQLQMAELFQTSVPNINMHLRNIFAEGELLPEATIKYFLIVQLEAEATIRKFRIAASGTLLNSLNGYFMARIDPEGIDPSDHATNGQEKAFRILHEVDRLRILKGSDQGKE